MKSRILTRLGLAALLAVAAASPVRAGIITATKVDGVNFQYQATVTNGVLKITFSNPSNFVTQINNTLISPITAEFAPLTLSPTALTDDTPGVSGHFSPGANSTQIGLSSLTPAAAPNVVFDYDITFGQASANGLTLSGTAALDAASATSFVAGPNTYDFSPFTNVAKFTLTLGTQSTTNLNLIYDVLKSGNGSFIGTAQFDAAVVVVPEPSSIALLGIGAVGTVLARRRRS